MLMRNKELEPSRLGENIITQVIEEFNKGSLTPELATKTFQTIWQVRGESTGTKVIVPPCNRTAEELTERIKAGRRIGYLPEQAVTQKGSRFGWFDYEARIEPPYVNTTEAQLRKIVASESERLKINLLGMNLDEYIVAGNDSKLFTGRYLDEGPTMSRLLGGRCDDGKVAIAYFDPKGYLRIRSYFGSRANGPGLGGRTVQY